PAFSRTASSLEEMLQSEFAYLRQADYLVHLNSEEDEFFRSQLPERSHHLLYPTIVLDERPLGNHFFLIVASANYPNFQSVEWFLDRVLPLCAPIHLQIVGNIDVEIRQRAPGLYKKYRRFFKGAVESIGCFYEDAIAVLIPCISGHGISIKTLEAM